jgi:CheY-like chemotaxis protein
MGKRPSAIVIDDDKDTVDVFCEYLKILNVDVLGWGYDGRDAIELYEERRPDVVFVDLMMPAYDGFFALESIKKFDPYANVVIITARYDDEVVKKLKRLKARKVLQKPFGAEQTTAILDEIIKSKVTV